jgi:prostaglandin-endoperoxide synthase 2
MSVVLGLLARRLPSIVRLIGRSPFLRRFASRALINRYAYAAKPRPRPFSTVSDHTTWRSLTDRGFSARHLGPHDAAGLPPASEVVDLFRRDTFRPATDTSVLFAFFAQWFTDSFLRTSPLDPARNDSNHEIDLCQIYGLDPDRTRMLRAGVGGRLRSQTIDGREFPEFLLERDADGRHVYRAPFRAAEGRPALHDETLMLDRILGRTPPEEKDVVFAAGLEHGNATFGSTLMNVIFLREHNRVAGEIAKAHPAWDDDRLFETARNVMIVVLLKIVIEDYIRHIAPHDFPLETVPFIADGERWNRPNWIAIEFNLLYRWHMLVPDEIPAAAGGARLGWEALRDNNRLVIERGVSALCAQLSHAPAGRMGLWNTPAFLHERRPQADGSLRSAEERTIDIMRRMRLAPFNAYRKAFGLKPAWSVDRLTADPRAREALTRMYGDIEKVEWFVGIFAEDYGADQMMGETLTTMVAYDAFTQALTNPLLGRNVFNEDTFSKTGMRILSETNCLRDLVARNGEGDPAATVARFSRPEART